MKNELQKDCKSQGQEGPEGNSVFWINTLGNSEQLGLPTQILSDVAGVL